MDNSRATVLAWSVPETCLSLAEARTILAPLGLVPQTLAMTEPYTTTAEMLVLHTANFDDLGQLGRAFAQLSKPGLIVVASEEEETQVLKWGLPITVDICQSRVLRDQLRERVQRVLEGTRSGCAGSASITGYQTIYGREYLDNRLAREFDNARKHCRSLSIAWIALRHLNRIVKIHGEAAENLFVSTFSQIAFANIRATDWLARYSPDEFCLVMPDTWLDEGRGVATRVREAVASTRIQVNGQSGFIPDLTLGVVELTDDEPGYEDLIQKATEAALMEKILARNPDAA